MHAFPLAPNLSVWAPPSCDVCRKKNDREGHLGVCCPQNASFGKMGIHSAFSDDFFYPSFLLITILNRRIHGSSGTLAFCFDLQSEMLHWVTLPLRERDKDPQPQMMLIFLSIKAFSRYMHVSV